MPDLTGLPYRPSVAAGDFVIVSGQVGIRDGAIVEDFAGEVDQIIENLKAQLAEHGLGLEHVVKTTCFVTDLTTFGVFNERYALAFPDPRPARSTVEVSGLPLGARAEIEAWGYRPS